jgi:hypothetical protein
VYEMAVCLDFGTVHGNWQLSLSASMEVAFTVFFRTSTLDKGVSRPSDQRRHHPPLRPAGLDPDGGGVNKIRGHATSCHPPDTNQHQNRVPEDAAVATNRCQLQGTATYGGIRLHGL